MLRPFSQRNNSDNVGRVLGVVIDDVIINVHDDSNDEENPLIELPEVPMHPRVPPLPRIRRPFASSFGSSFRPSNVVYEERIQKLEETIDILKKNLTKLMESYPKKYLFEKIIDNKCSICLEKYNYGDEIAVTNCIHLFHKKCIDESIENSCLDCPNCRFSLTNSIFLYINFSLELNGTEFL